MSGSAPQFPGYCCTVLAVPVSLPFSLAVERLSSLWIFDCKVNKSIDLPMRGSDLQLPVGVKHTPRRKQETGNDSATTMEKVTHTILLYIKKWRK